MAKSQKKAARGAQSKAPSGGRSATKTQSKKQRAAPAAEVEIVEEERGLGLDDGMIIAASLLLFVAILMIDYARGAAYGEGLFF